MIGVYVMNFPMSFYCATRDFADFSHPVPAPAMRRSFTVEKVGAPAKLLICGLGLYRLFVNGSEITRTILAPYISNPDDILYYDSYDLSDLLNVGENVIGVILGNGMLNCPGGTVWDFQKATFRSAPKLALSFECGELSFDASAFVWAESPIIFDDIRCGCFYDARKELPGWDAPGFDGSGWKPVIKAETPRGTPRICDVDPIGCTRTLSPVSTERNASVTSRDSTWHMHPMIAGQSAFEKYLPANGGVCFDFGENTTGVVRLVLKNTTPGQKIDLQFAEMLTDDGVVQPENIARFYPDGFGQRDIYICRGADEEIFVPSFTYHGFRYCYVVGLRGDQISEDTLTYMVCSTELKEIGGFESSSHVLNTLQKIVRNSDLSNFWHFPTDCPHREKNGWTGDASISSEHFLLNLDATRNLREWMRNIRAAQLDDGRVPGIVPTGGWGFAWGNGPAWDAVLFNIPYFCYVMRGCRGIVEENADSMFRYLYYAAGKRDADGILAYGLSDWCACDEDSGETKNTPLAVTDTLVIADCAQKAAYMFGQLGRQSEADYAMKLHDELIASFRRKFVDPDSLLVATGSQTAQACALFYGVFSRDEDEKAFGVLLDLIRKNNYHMSGGCIGLRTLFHVLADRGEADLAYRMVTQPDAPSFRTIVDEGFTSLPEVITSKERLWRRRPSLNHHFFGDISNFFIRDIVGIRINPDLDNPSRVGICPAFIDGLEFADAFYETVGGTVSVRWERSGDCCIDLHISADEGVSGYIRLPRGWHFEDGSIGSKKLASGIYKAVRN